ncbi:MerR family transcriptional regulator [Allobranchiibius sp. CTAmp26]|uniref:transcriptional regulator FtsR n=1 Tax=Allobranchiibius sp. CTAmp26 TaxID=2815214 RepID=UPI001AA15CFC|nr:MerR family transcriptional regulator [Allobranchiibius sp. CTAmp26]MBO1754416.1 MerR family transcriptional regulator [Allobranchiibius sp. CTAmp26]
MPPAPEGGSHTVGAVLALLREDFPDLTISKVRFLDAEGLVSPGRSPSGYRRYSNADLDRLRFVLTAQRDRFWPLKVIREALDAYDRGLQPPQGPDARPVAPPPVGDPALRAPDAPLREEREKRAEPPLRLTLAEVARGSGLNEAQVRDLAGFGLITPDAGYFDRQALVVARSAAALMARGLGARHLRTFRLAAEREAAMVAQLRGRGGRGAESEQVVGECLALHLALLRAQVALHP